MSRQIIPITASFEERAEALLSCVFGGMHHVFGLKKFPAPHPYWTCSQYGSLATYDFNHLTRLVFAAHEYCCRVEIAQGGPGRLKILIHPRVSRTGDSAWEKHPDISEALERWNAR